MKKQVILMNKHGVIIERNEKPLISRKENNSIVGWFRKNTNISVGISVPAILLAFFTLSNPVTEKKDPIKEEIETIDSLERILNPYRAETIANAVYLRVQPDISAKKEAWLSFGKQFTVIDKTKTKSEIMINNRLEIDYWYKVIFIENNIKYEGWAFGSLIRPLKA